MPKSNFVSFNTRDLSLNKKNHLQINGFVINLYHKEGDPPMTNRVVLFNGQIELELLPSKGLSVGQATIHDQKLFWDPPVGLPDTENIDLWSDEIHINGSPAPGFAFLKTFTGGIEMYGLRNWGMPRNSEGQLYPLHGETSNIPVNEIVFELQRADQCSLEASFIYRTFKGDEHLPWYERGVPLFRVTKRITLSYNTPVITLQDTIENITTEPLAPSWGYHITFRPEDGAKLIVPSEVVNERGGNVVPPDYDTWYSAENEKIRVETGIIHKKIKRNRNSQVTSRVIYPNNTGLTVTTPYSPYYQTWFCCGGKGSKEFADAAGRSILERNWDGMGIEIGNDALDHDNNVDSDAEKSSPMLPGKKQEILIEIEWMNRLS